jgi:hypothetical protein
VQKVVKNAHFFALFVKTLTLFDKKWVKNEGKMSGFNSYLESRNSGGGEVGNSKSEARSAGTTADKNPKRIRNSNVRMSKTGNRDFTCWTQACAD